MSDKTSLFVKLAMAWMIFVALGALAWKWRDIGHMTPGTPEARRLMAQAITLMIYPAWFVVGWRLARKRLASPHRTPSAEHVRWFETSMLVAGVALVVVQGWTARNFILDETLGRLALLRGMTVFVGVLTAVQGNFLAKVAPPGGEGAPEAGAWSRAMLGIGWGMTAVGLAVTVCAITLPVRLLFPTLLVAVAALTINSLANRRRLGQPGQHR